MEKRERRLLSNTIIFAIGPVATKILSFAMVPFYTNMLSRANYGTLDVISTATAALAPVVSLSIFDAVFRWTVDGKSNPKAVFSTGLMVWLAGIMAMTLIATPFLLAGTQYLPLVLLNFTLGSFMSIMHALIRGLGYVKLFTVNSILNTLVFMSLAILFLFGWNLGVTGYMLAGVGSSVVSILLMGGYTQVWQYWQWRAVNRELMNKMLQYTLPLIPNALSWWGIASANRLIILSFAGVAANGLYAVANKLPSLINLGYNAFLQSWQISAVQSYDDEDVSAYYSRTFNTVLKLQLAMVMVILIGTQLAFKLFIAPAYFAAWTAVPWLLLTVVYTNMSAFVGTTYLAAKKTKGLFLTTVYGALTSVLTSVGLVPFLGINGASLGGMLGFLVVLVLRLYETRQYVGIQPDYLVLTKYHLAILLQVALMFILPVGFYQVSCLTLITFGMIWTDWPFFNQALKVVIAKR